MSKKSRFAEGMAKILSYRQKKSVKSAENIPLTPLPILQESRRNTPAGHDPIKDAFKVVDHLHKIYHGFSAPKSLGTATLLQIVDVPDASFPTRKVDMVKLAHHRDRAVAKALNNLSVTDKQALHQLFDLIKPSCDNGIILRAGRSRDKFFVAPQALLVAMGAERCQMLIERNIRAPRQGKRSLYQSLSDLDRLCEMHHVLALRLGLFLVGVTIEQWCRRTSDVPSVKRDM